MAAKLRGDRACSEGRPNAGKNRRNLVDRKADVARTESCRRMLAVGGGWEGETAGAGDWLGDAPAHQRRGSDENVY